MATKTEHKRLAQLCDILEFALCSGRKDVQGKSYDRKRDAVFDCLDGRWVDVKDEIERLLGDDLQVDLE